MQAKWLENFFKEREKKNQSPTQKECEIFKKTRTTNMFRCKNNNESETLPSNSK